MKICLIGQNITNLILALMLSEKKLAVDIYQNNNKPGPKSDRTIAISNENFKYLKDLIKIHIPSWPTNEIKIFLEKKNSKEIINFKKKRKETFNLISYSKLTNICFSQIKKSRYIKTNKIDKTDSSFIKKIEKYNLVINCDKKNSISKKYFYNKLKKNYKSYAYTFIINHKKLINNTASQIFTKFGPLAFLPIGNSKTSIVFSCSGILKDNEQIINLFKNYNNFYDVKKINKIEKFPLIFYTQRNYIYKNILAFGDLIHTIHPLAGQGLNMTIRDIKILSKIIDKKNNLGLPVDISVGEEFQKKTKHLNYLYGKAIDAIYEFFKLDSKLNNSMSEPIFNVLNKNSLFKKYSNLFSEKGFNL